VTGTCLLCGHVGAVHRHHVTGRSSRGGRYFDAQLTVALCAGCHTGAGGIHQMLNIAGLVWLG
jgi:hypothetical protein